MPFQIGEYLIISLSIILLTSAWRLADWKNWSRYYPTILFIMFVNSSSTILQYNHSLWYFHELAFIPNHIVADFLIELTHLPLIILVFLSRYPYQARPFKQIAYTSFWVIAFSLIEGLFYITENTSYHNGWNYWWSVLLWAIMFLVMRLHHSKPLWAWLICLGCTFFVIRYFDLPITELK